MTEEIAFVAIKTREELAEFLGDCREWEKEWLFIDGNDVPLYRCPQCGAACLNNFQHKAWHLQICL